MRYRSNFIFWLLLITYIISAYVFAKLTFSYILDVQTRKLLLIALKNPENAMAISLAIISVVMILLAIYIGNYLIRLFDDLLPKYQINTVFILKIITLWINIMLIGLNVWHVWLLVLNNVMILIVLYGLYIKKSRKICISLLGLLPLILEIIYELAHI